MSTEGGWKTYGIFDFSSLTHVSLHDEKWRRLGQHEPNAQHWVEITHFVNSLRTCEMIFTISEGAYEGAELSDLSAQ